MTNEVRTTCCYCGVGCGVIVRTEGASITGVRGDPDHPANQGLLCSKGLTLHLTSGSGGRLLHPEMRASRSTGVRHQVGWDEALDHASARFAAIIREHGPDAVAFYVSGQLLTEDYYVFNKLAKGLIGTNNIDTNSRLCMSSAVAGYKATLGADAPPACYEDIDHAQCLFIAGSNTAFAHPVLYRRIEAARRRNPALKTIVVDPRRTVTAREATLHLPILPGTDVALFNGMLHVMLWEGLCDLDYIRERTEGFEAVKDAVREYTPAVVAETCGIPVGDIVTAAKWFGQSGATLSLYCQGLNQYANGTQNNAALINLHLATGQVGRAGAGPLSLTGQPNAMGGREVGGLANLLTAHRDLDNPAHRAEVAALWGVPSVPAKPGKSAVELFDALHAGSVKAVWIACTNPAQSMPDVSHVREALSRAEFVVLQEAYAGTDTAEFADLLLPAATWGEKEGTVTNSERRITRVHRAVAPPGAARCDWQIARDFALRLGAALNCADAQRMFGYATAEEVFNEHRESTRGRDLDITGLSYALLDTAGPQQWPFPEGATAGTARLYADRAFPTPSGRARFAKCAYRATAEKTDARYPLHFNTGRLRDQWHSMTRSGRVAQLCNHAEEPVLAMNRRDMDRRLLEDGDVVRVKGRRGQITVRVAASDDLRAGQTFLPMHWGSQFMNSAGANALTSSHVDPMSLQPELKHASVQVEKLDVPTRIVAMRRLGEGDLAGAQDVLDQMKPLLGRFTHASLGLTGRDAPVAVLRGYSQDAIADDVLEALDRVLQMDPSCTMRYVDARRRVEKAARIESGIVQSVCLAGETAAQDWLKAMMVQGASADAVRPWILAPLSSVPRGTLNRGRIVCSCLDVSEDEIGRQIAAGAALAEVQTELGCGTQCGSCVPELRRLFDSRVEAAA